MTVIGLSHDCHMTVTSIDERLGQRSSSCLAQDMERIGPAMAVCI
jgi:hypothetical protein